VASDINVAGYYLPPKELKQLVLDRVAQAAPNSLRLALDFKWYTCLV
jgi:hypothetical protein